MKTFRNILIATAALSAIAGSAMAADNTASASVSVSGKLIQPITITSGNALDFGTATTSAGTVTVPTTGARTASGPSLIGTTYSPATFNVGGENNQAFNIAFTPTITTANVSLGSLTASGCAYASGAGSIASGNACTLTVGGTLTIAAGATAGTVSGTLQTVVTYQ